MAAAAAELEAVRLVGKQLAAFRGEMERDAATQRAAMGKVGACCSREERLALGQAGKA